MKKATTIMQALAPLHCSRLLVMLFATWAVVWGASLTAAAPLEPTPSTDVSLVWQGDSYLCYPVAPKLEEAQEDNTMRLEWQAVQAFQD